MSATKPAASGQRLANFEGDNANVANLQDHTSAMNQISDVLLNSGLNWSDIRWLQSITRLPIVLKGILTAEDALLAADLGVAAILVSNHGGRQLDGAPASIEALPEIVKAVSRRDIEIYLDGGVRNGTDVFKALALGAKMVFLGRPILWGLAHSGEAGVARILEIIRKEFDYVMAMAGCSSLAAIDRGMVVHQSFYTKL